MDIFVQEKIFLFLSLLVGILAAGCSDGQLTPISGRSICLADHPMVLPEATREEIEHVSKVLIAPAVLMQSAQSEGPLKSLFDGVKNLGWKVVQFETTVQSSDASADLRRAAGMDATPDVVVFFTLPQSVLKQWDTLCDAPFTKILITEELSNPGEIEAAKVFTSFGNAIFARNPEKMTLAIAPKRLLSFPFYRQVQQLDRDAVRVHKLSRPPSGQWTRYGGAKSVLPQSEASEIYVINLERSKPRLQFMEEQFIRQGLSFLRVPAVDGKNLDPEELARAGVVQVWPEYLDYTLSRGEIGVYFSQRNAWIDFLSNSAASVALILEDDVVLADGFSEKLRAVLSQAPADWDLIFLGCSGYTSGGCAARPGLSTIQDGKFTIIDKRCGTGAYSYLINKASAKKIISSSLPMLSAVDGYLHRTMIAGLQGPFHAYCANPELATVNFDLGSEITALGRK
jgi:GR25 family glycosyltransferase involved in LPS biosynthesis